jgi:hypothetical protein
MILNFYNIFFFTLSTIKWHQWLGHLFVNVIKNEKKLGLRINDQINDLFLFENYLAKKEHWIKKIIKGELKINKLLVFIESIFVKFGKD